MFNFKERAKLDSEFKKLLDRKIEIQKYHVIFKSKDTSLNCFIKVANEKFSGIPLDDILLVSGQAPIWDDGEQVGSNSWVYMTTKSYFEEIKKITEEMIKNRELHDRL